jgi:tetratricopeptide (TPR) repeat protein
MLKRLWRGLRPAAPNDPEADFRRAVGHYERREFDIVIALLEAVVDRAPAHAGACNMLGLVLARERARFDEGAGYLRRAVTANPALREARSNLGWVLTEMGALDEGLQCLDSLLGDVPDDHDARLMRATANLKYGRFAEGWRDYGARHHSATAIASPYAFPVWDGSTQTESALLVTAEQGVGDQIMFASCLAEARQRVGRMMIECHPHLVPLLRRAFPRDIVGTRGTAGQLPAWAVGQHIDLQLPFGSLPGFFRNTAADCPRHSGFLSADPVRVAYWKRRLDLLGPGTKTGLSWQGGTANSRRSLRSMEPAGLATLLRQPGYFVNLQYGSTEADLAVFRGLAGDRFIHWPDALDDYDETAALVVALDLVVSVCTAVIHLAGSLGRPVWVLVPAIPEWRYLASGTQLPWYPTARLFRQRRIFDWDEVVAGVARDFVNFKSQDADM